MIPRLLLASNSPRRQELLKTLGWEFEVVVEPVREVAPGVLPPVQLSIHNAELKAAAVSKKYPDALVLAADTEVVFDNESIGKPRDIEDARRTLLRFSGKFQRVSTGVALFCRNTHYCHSWSESADITFRTIDNECVKRYMSMVNVLDKAGSYAVQEYGDMLISKIDGDINAVIGLPLIKLASLLANYPD